MNICDFKNCPTVETIENIPFEYGENPSVVLTVTGLVITCTKCNLSFTDHRVEDLKQDAVIKHLLDQL